jgi:nucleoside 2-deoxyribosyltransferase
MDALFFISKSIAGADRKDQVDFSVAYLQSRSYVKAWPTANNPTALILLPSGMQRVDELQKDTRNSKTAFVAMSFAAGTENLRNAIKEGIIGAGYTPRLMDEIEHNHQIVPEMLYEIRNSRFVVAELSHHNNGAYYEAGYALGVGKEVIHICEKKEMNSSMHFDVKQINTILWESESDLSEKLKKRIRATIS